MSTGPEHLARRPPASGAADLGLLPRSSGGVLKPSLPPARCSDGVLQDGIYPQWTTFVKPIHHPESVKESRFHSAQAAARKDVERAFGILQSQFAIVREPARFWDEKTLWRIMTAAVILHNMIIENERDQDVDHHYDFMGRVVNPRRRVDRIEHFLRTHHEIRDADTHRALKDDLVEEWWKWSGQQER